jgi:hypothetical protein
MEQERKSFEVIPIRHLRQNVGGAYNMAGEPDLLRIGPEMVHSFIQFGTSDDCRTVVGIGLGQSGGLNIPPDEGNRTFFMAPGVSCAGPGAVFVGQEHTGIVKTGAEEPLYQRIGGKKSAITPQAMEKSDNCEGDQTGMPQIVIGWVADSKTGKFSPEYISSVNIDACDQGDIDLGADNSGKGEHLLHRIVLSVAIEYVCPALYWLHEYILSVQRRHRKAVEINGATKQRI